MREEHNSTRVDIPDNNPDLHDEFVGEYYGDEDRQDNPEHEKQVKGITSKISLSRKGMLIALALVATLIVVVLVSGKLPLPNLGFLGGASETLSEGEGGVASNLLEGYDEAAEGKGSESAEQDNVDIMINDLREYYPGYEITRDDESKTINLVGTLEGQSHTVVMNFNGEIVDEITGSTAVGATTTTSTTVPATSGGSTAPATNGETVSVSVSDYNKYHISKKQQNYIKPDPTETTPSITTTKERLIVEYEKLPVRGSALLVYSKVIETGEEVIFPVTLKQYSSLDDVGTTVIQVTRSEGYGVKTIDDVILVNWQD